MPGGRRYGRESDLRPRQPKRRPGSPAIYREAGHGHSGNAPVSTHRTGDRSPDEAEHEQTMDNIARYEDILNNYDSMAACDHGMNWIGSRTGYTAANARQP